MKFDTSFVRPANLYYFLVSSFVDSSIRCPRQLFEVVRGGCHPPILQIRKPSPWLAS